LTVTILEVVEFAGGVTGFGLKLHVVPDGSPVQDNVTGLLNPYIDVTVFVVNPLSFLSMNSVVGEQLIQNPGA
jgi:hypothetical protein